MKSKLHIPTEQFGFTEIEVETETAEEALDLYQSLSRYVNVQPKGALSPKDYDLFIENMLLGKGNSVEMYETMSQKQRDFVQIIKRAIKRLKARQSKQ